MKPSPNPRPTVERVALSRLPEVTTVLCEAFFDYPTMRFVLGDSKDYAERLPTLIRFFVESTVLQGGTVFALVDGGRIVAAADTVRSWPTEPAELEQRRAIVWEDLGGDARRRYAEYCAVKDSFVAAAPHYYLSMLGVVNRWKGQGLARALLEEVHAFSRADPTSTGVALETEDPRNVGFYEHFGYQLLGHGRISGTFESWGFFRPD